jgi:hypothetical protein
MKTTLDIFYGGMHPPIDVQLKQQGFLFDEEKVKEFESNRQSAVNLYWANMITNTVYDKILQKIHNKLTFHIKRKNKALLSKAAEKPKPTLSNEN